MTNPDQSPAGVSADGSSHTRQGEPKTSEAREIRSAVVHTHWKPEVTSEAVRMLVQSAERAGVELRFDQEEAAKHGLDRGDVAQDDAETPDVCIVLGGDGTTLRSLRHYVGTKVPVFSINCGRIGFLATVDRDRMEEGFELALRGRFEVMSLSSLLLDDGPDFALNEVSFQRGSHMNVAHLSYSLAGAEVVRAPCDGLIAATPAGSTAYNLSAGGPLLSWGLHGFAVSMVAPHVLSARALVAAPDDVLRVVNEGAQAVDVVLDGMRTGELGPGDQKAVSFRPDAVGLAQLPGSSFYSRFREKLRLLTA
jgi:NAD+ kinase